MSGRKYTQNDLAAAVRAERERCAGIVVAVAQEAANKYQDNPVHQPYANNRLWHVGWDAAVLILRPSVMPVDSPALASVKKAPTISPLVCKEAANDTE